MTNLEQPTLLRLVQNLEPFIASAIKRESEALQFLCDEFQVDTITDLKKKIEQLLKDYNELIRNNNNSPEQFATRVLNYREAKNNSLVPEEPIESLVDDFKNFTSPNIKKIGKILGVNLTKKGDAAAFSNWLETGIKPSESSVSTSGRTSPRKEFIEASVIEALNIRDQTTKELTEESSLAIMEIAESVYAKYKLVGLREFIIQFGMSSSTGKNKTELMAQLESALAEETIRRSKSSANLEDNPYLDLLTFTNKTNP